MASIVEAVIVSSDRYLKSCTAYTGETTGIVPVHMAYAYVVCLSVVKKQRQSVDLSTSECKYHERKRQQDGKEYAGVQLGPFVSQSLESRS